jgi:hypothetical protein
MTLSQGSEAVVKRRSVCIKQPEKVVNQQTDRVLTNVKLSRGTGDSLAAIQSAIVKKYEKTSLPILETRKTLINQHWSQFFLLLMPFNFLLYNATATEFVTNS